MILQKQTEANVLFEGDTQQSIGMSLDLDSAHVLMQMLSKNLYSDAIGSSIRETCSNALDSHRRAGVTKPIVVSFGPTKDGSYEFSVEDFGLGLDENDVENIISKYGKSTKRESNVELGMFGLGFKAPLAYSSSFYFVARKNGVERKYMMYEGEDVNTIDLLYEAQTDEPNGVKVIIPIKYSDNYSFNNKIKEQLAYFENVYFNVNGIDNSFKILRTKDYQLSTLAQDPYMHICLDDVYYPLDFEKLGINRIQIPIGLRFDLSDGLFPTPNREALRYTEEAKKVILDKIKLVADQLMTKFNESIEVNSDIETIYHFFGWGSKKLRLNDQDIHISYISEHSSIPIGTPKLEGINHLNLDRIFNKVDRYILDEYNVKFTFSNSRFSEAKHYYSQRVQLSDLISGYCYLVEDFPKKLRDYTRDTFPSHYYSKFFFKKVKSFKLFPKDFNTISKYYDNYYDILNLENVPRDLWRTYIKEFQLIISKLLEYANDYTNVTIDQQWIDSKKKPKVKITVAKDGVVDGKRVKAQGEVICKQATNLIRYVDGRNCKFESKTLKIEEFSKHKGLIIYTSHDEYLKLDALYNILNKHNVKLITFSSRELNIIDKLEIHNLIPYTKFMEGKNKLFRRIVTAYLIDKLMEKNMHTFNHSNSFQNLSNSLYTKLNDLQRYKRVNMDSTASKNIYDAMLEVATEQNLFDFSIYDTYMDIKNLLEKYTFINTICKKMLYNDNDMIDVLRDLFKYNKQRIDYTNYNIKLNEEVNEELVEEHLEHII